ncbi:MAG: TVP38/TMEM64 family protein, partial [Bdellovibrionales bacterium]|nr:TVP38/TMEM64 family protein [Bdellovibrionales bacterium]
MTLVYRGRWLLAGAVAAAVLPPLIWFYVPPVQAFGGSLLDDIVRAGANNPLYFVGVYIASCLLLIPVPGLAFAIGFLFGLVRGVTIVFLGVTIGATAAFFVSRFLFYRAVDRRIKRSENLTALNDAIEIDGWKIVFAARLCPIVPFRLTNYAIALTKIPVIHYILATWLGSLPAAVAYVYLGTIGKDLSRAALDDEAAPFAWGLEIL